MARYIDADKAIEIWKDHDFIKLVKQEETAQHLLDILPTENVAPVTHAHWIYEIDDLFPEDSMMICSNCGEYERLGANDNYCGECGAKMDEEVE